jgi:hypothetical protein
VDTLHKGDNDDDDDDDDDDNNNNNMSIHTYIHTSFRSHYGPGVDSTPNRNEYQVYFLEVRAAGA